MAKKVIEGNAIEGILSQDEEQERKTSFSKREIKKIQGRPKAKDITEKTELIKRAFYITPIADEELGIYAIKNKMDKSEAIRHILKEFFSKDTLPLPDERSE